MKEKIIQDKIRNKVKNKLKKKSVIKNICQLSSYIDNNCVVIKGHYTT